MRILITGAAGLVGHAVVEHILRTTDHEVVALNRLNTSGNLQRLADMSCWWEQRHRVKLVYHDLRGSINSFVANQIGEVDWILGLAAQSHVDRSQADPGSCIQDNVWGMYNLLEFARTLPKLKAFNLFSTDEVEGPSVEGYDFKETDRYNAGNIYASTKCAQEQLGFAYGNCYDVPVIVTRTMNIYYPRQEPVKFVPLCIKKILAGEEIQIHSDPTKTKAGTRYWINGRNVADALLFILNLKQHDKEGLQVPVYNIRGSKRVSNLEMAQMIADIIGKPLKYRMVDFHTGRKNHDMHYSLDGSKLTNLGWKPPVSFEESLRKTVEWTVAHPEWLKA